MRFIKSIYFKMQVWLCSNDGYIRLLRRKGAHIGKDCVIHKSVGFGEEGYLIFIGNNVRITSGVRITPHDGGLWTLRKLGLLPDADFFRPIYIGDNCHIGNDSVIMPGVKIGKNSVIGTGAIVTKSIPENSVAVGSPARVIESIDEYYEKRKDKCDKTKHMSAAEKRQYYTKKFDI